MTPDKALELLDKAASTVSSNREGHLMLIEASKTIAELIQSTRPPASAQSGP